MTIGIREILIILVIVLLIFGAKRLRTIGSDIGGFIGGLRKSVSDGSSAESNQRAKKDSERLELEPAPTSNDAPSERET